MPDRRGMGGGTAQTAHAVGVARPVRDLRTGPALRGDGGLDRSGMSPRRRARLRRSTVVLAALLLLGAVVVRLAYGQPDLETEATQQVAGAAQTPAGGEGTAPIGAATSAVAAPGTGTRTTGQPAGPPAPPAPGGTDDDEADLAEDPPVTPGAQYGVAAAVPATGAGSIRILTVPAGPLRAEGRTIRYTIEAEDGLPVDNAAFVHEVHAVLSDPRGWQAQDSVRFVPVSPQAAIAGANVDMRVTLASPALTAQLCAPANVTTLQVSCWNGGRAVLNLTRWLRGAHTYGADLAGYRTYQVNHEVGHGLGHGHVRCPSPGGFAPVMMQQTKGLQGCRAWGFPTSA